MKTETLKNTALEPIAPHFFTTGEYEVWAPGVSSNPRDNSLKKVADGLSAKTALAYEWQGMEIRLHGKAITKAEIRASLQSK